MGTTGTVCAHRSRVYHIVSSLCLSSHSSRIVALVTGGSRLDASHSSRESEHTLLSTGGGALGARRRRPTAYERRMRTIVTGAASRGGPPNPRPPQILALQMIEGPKIVRCRWCPSARCAEHDLRRERKSRRRRHHFDAAVAGAAVGTTETARASLACSSHRSHRSSRLIASRLVSVVYRQGSLGRDVASPPRASPQSRRAASVRRSSNTIRDDHVRQNVVR